LRSQITGIGGDASQGAILIKINVAV